MQSAKKKRKEKVREKNKCKNIRGKNAKEVKGGETTTHKHKENY